MEMTTRNSMQIETFSHHRREDFVNRKTVYWRFTFWKNQRDAETGHTLVYLTVHGRNSEGISIKEMKLIAR